MLEYSDTRPRVKRNDKLPAMPVFFQSKKHRQLTQAVFCIKFILYLAFTLVQTFENEVLCLFMLS